MKWWQIRKRDADLKRELQSDLELEEEEQRANGLSGEEGRCAARRAFGNTTLALHKLEHRGWIRAHLKPSENNRRARFYSLTQLGRKQLEKETANWNRVSAAISDIVQLEEV
jgi:hypothetical protein